MLETFSWTGGVVFTNAVVTVIAAQSPDWDLLAGFARGAVFGFVLDGENTTLRRYGRALQMRPGAYFVVNAGAAELTSPGGRIMLVHKIGADFPFQLGGPLEPVGRLRYIDGCTDSLLVPPWRLGEPCLNHLHIPAGVEQTMHTHPSDRIGVVVRGRGQCVTPDGVSELAPGVLWRLPADAPHRFRTDEKSIDIVAWHPDSDVGPTDEVHPMKSRTLVDGVSASRLPAISTAA